MFHPRLFLIKLGSMNTQITVKPFPIVLVTLISLTAQLFIPLFIGLRLTLDTTFSIILSLVLSSASGLLYVWLAKPATTQTAASGGALLAFSVAATLALITTFNQQASLPQTLALSHRLYLLGEALLKCAFILPLIAFVGGLSTGWFYRRNRPARQSTNF